MSWIPLVTIAALIWALTNIVDKTMLEKYIKSPYVPFIISVLVSVIAGSTILIVMQSKIPFINAITIIIAGVFYSLGTFLYFKSIQKDDVSSIVPFFQLTPLILLLFGAFFLEEVLLGVQYVGIFLLVGGAILISLKNVQRFRWSKAAPLMVLSSLMYATAYTIMKYNLESVSVWETFAYMKFGGIIVAVWFIPTAYREIKQIIKGQGFSIPLIVVGNEFSSIFAFFLYTLAASIGYVTLVEALSSIQTLFVFLLALGVSFISPQWFKEQIKKETIIQKSIAIILIIAGSFLIT